MSEILRPENPDQLVELVNWAVSEKQPLKVIGSDSKSGLGRPVQAHHTVSLSAFNGIRLYEPEELVLSAGAGTPLADIRSALQETGQEMAFEPPNLSAFYGSGHDEGTLGGLLACNLAGPRRIKIGAARDHFLGFSAVTGRGELVKSGGRVVKNVTGYDLSKLLAGSYGTLGIMTEVTVKVLPGAEKLRTVLVYGLEDAQAVSALSQSLGSPHEVSAAAHLPASTAADFELSRVSDAGRSVTAVRVEGPEPSAVFRCEALRKELSALGETEELHGKNSKDFWSKIANLHPFVQSSEQIVWKVSTAPTAGPGVAARILDQRRGQHFYDWGGGLLWIGFDPAGTEDDGGTAIVREAIAEAGGHATLMRAPDALRAAVPVFQPQDAGKAALSARLKNAFDPSGVLNPGRIYADS
ncbi:glycolate oxidase subunit GlcE [Fodinicurvata sediminis]|uniref:glycolate oxidase subunit GlcE n=1 Tax=Fodinicurvata sediminis TaxID=1121832 RepID=UPI0003B7986B|nr:glycolate oxidase subunit GlcE [Fodinicurvata sediminis]